jgi:ribosomal protein S12 methylthiotransferase accessory factor
MTPECPILNPHVAVHRIAGDLLLVVDEDGARPLPGALFPRIVALVNGRRSVMEIADRLADHATLVDVVVSVEELIVEGVLCDGAMAEPGLDARGAFDARLATRPRVDDVRIVVTSDYLSDELAEINQDAIRSGRPWLLAKPTGAVAWVGPLFTVANTSPCWACLASRLREVNPWRAYVERHRGEALGGPFTPPVVTAAIEAAADAAADWRRSDALQTFDSRTGNWTTHAVDRRADCPACGRTHPSAPPRVDADLARHVSPITGIVGAVSKREVPDATVHIAVVDHIFPPEIDQVDAVWRGLRRRSMAGGVTDGDARASAIGEAVERYSGVFRFSDPVRCATYAELGSVAIHPNDVMGFSETQIANRTSWNAAHPHAYARVPEPFDPDEPRAWTALSSLRDGDVRWLPTASCYFGVEPILERRSCIADSNGCAAGPTFDAAVVSGFLELIERDAVGIWWHNRIERAGIDLATVGDPFVQSVREAYQRMGRDLRVLDISTDLRVPAFAALSSEPGAGAADLTLGFGAHFDPLRALRHALIELNLFLPELSAGRRRAICSGPEPAGSYLWPATLKPWTAGVPAAASSIAAVAAVATDHGLEVFVLDQTRADAGVPVARIVAPGLCHFWARRGVRRLFEVPVAMGWRATPEAERNLNDSLLLL